jgi:hypothetical protein
MFLLSKLFWVFAQPLSIAFLLSAVAALLAFAGRRRLSGLSALLAALVLLVTLFTTTGTVALQILEARFARQASDPVDVACMIVLGGAFDNEINTARGGIELNQAADRFVDFRWRRIDQRRLRRRSPNRRTLLCRFRRGDRPAGQGECLADDL